MTSSKVYREADCATTKEIRDVAPAHYVLEIKSFSLFAKNNMEKYESSEFEAEGYKWKLIIYPIGDKSRNGDDHISVYIAVSGTSPFQLGGAIHVAVRFSLYDQICDTYLTEQGRAVRFHTLKTEWGVPRYMPLKTFTDPSNGYLVDDTCVFGVEVFVVKSSGVGERLTLKESASYTLEWKLSRLSSLGDGCRDSKIFTVGDYRWNVELYPTGDSANKGQSLSTYIYFFHGDKLASGQTVNARYVIRLKGQNNVVHHQSEVVSGCFSSSAYRLGWGSFMRLETAQERLKDESFVIEVELTVLGTISKLP